MAVAIPKHPRPHQVEFQVKEEPAEPVSLKQQLINQVAMGNASVAHQLREQLRNEQVEEEETPIHRADCSGASYVAWQIDDTVVETITLTATDGAKEYFAALKGAEPDNPEA